MIIIQEISNIDMISRIGKFGGNGYFHWHENVELIHIQEGCMKILVDGDLLSAKEGDVIVIPSRSIHRFVVDQGQVVCRVCQFPLKILLNEGIQVEKMKTVITKEEIDEDPIFSEQVSALFRMIDWEGAVKKGEKNVVLQCLFSALYFLIMRKFPQEEKDQFLIKEKKDFYEVVEYINHHYTEEITVQSLAEVLFMSRGKLTKLFEKYAGSGVPEYINSLRINQANHMLETGKSITETAFECGFPSTRTFNNVYKKMTNMTPSEYMKNKKNKGM